MATTAELVIAGVCGFGFGLSKDIIFSWLNIGRDKKDPGSCADHQEKLARLEERVDGHDKELDKGGARFKRIEETLENVNKGVIVLLDRSDRRREGDYDRD